MASRTERKTRCTWLRASLAVSYLVAIVAVGTFGCGSGEDDPAEVQYLPLSGVLRRPQIISGELVFRKVYLRHLDSTARRELPNTEGFTSLTEAKVLAKEW